MNSIEAYGHLYSNLCNYATGQSAVRHTNKYPPGTAWTDYDRQTGYALAYVGFPSYCYNWNFVPYVNMNELVSCLTAIHHDGYHTLQYSRYFHDTSVNDYRWQAESFLSKQYNNDTYEREYDKFSYEIAAERYGVISTYNYMNCFMPMEDANKLICNYVNNKMHRGRDIFPYFLNKQTDYRYIGDIVSDFDKAYRASFTALKDFNVPGTSVSNYRKAMMGVDRSMSMITNGYDQARAVICLTGMEHPDIYDFLPEYRYLSSNLSEVYKHDPSGKSLAIDSDANFSGICQNSLIYGDDYAII